MFDVVKKIKQDSVFSLSHTTVCVHRINSHAVCDAHIPIRCGLYSETKCTFTIIYDMVCTKCIIGDRDERPLKTHQCHIVTVTIIHLKEKYKLYFVLFIFFMTKKGF